MLKSIASILTVVITTTLTIILPTAISLAAAITCKGTLTNITVQNIQVPSGYTCILKGTIVKGNIVVNNGATLKTMGIKVLGSIQTIGTAFIEVDSNSIIRDGIVSIK
jgi:hypothetical protein